jgi:opacity protein-like surface antigen
VLFGRYLTPSLRVDLSMDFRSTSKVVKDSKASYTTRLYEQGRDITVTRIVGFQADGTPIERTVYNGPSQNYNIYNVDHSEVTTSQAHTFMLNASYDLTRIGNLKPYVGAGVGLAVHMLNRRTLDQGICANGPAGQSNPHSRGGWNDILDTYGVDQSGSCWDSAANTTNPGKLPVSFKNEGTSTRSGVGLAAALMAGATYSVSPRTHIDMNYRMIWMGGKVVTSAPLAPTDVYSKALTTVEVGNRFDHEIRTGLRFDLW